MIPKSTRERWRSLSNSRTRGKWWQSNQSGAIYSTCVDRHEILFVGDVDMAPQDVALVLDAPDAMSQLLDENARLRELVREAAEITKRSAFQRGLIGASTRHWEALKREADADDARITAITAEVEE